MTQLRRTTPFARPVKVLQFGQGNFMRGFFDWQIDLLNERAGLDAGVVVVRPRGGSSTPLLDVQDGLFTVLVRGLDETGQPVKQYRKVECVQREIDLAPEEEKVRLTLEKRALTDERNAKRPTWKILEHARRKGAPGP